jgi:hypothetical protein
MIISSKWLNANLTQISFTNPITLCGIEFYYINTAILMQQTINITYDENGSPVTMPMALNSTDVISTDIYHYLHFLNGHLYKKRLINASLDLTSFPNLASAWSAKIIYLEH